MAFSTHSSVHQRLGGPLGGGCLPSVVFSLGLLLHVGYIDIYACARWATLQEESNPCRKDQCRW